MEEVTDAADATGSMDILGGGDATAAPKSPAATRATDTDQEAFRENVDHPFLRALQYDLVADKIVSLLNFEDMKALSVVSLDCLAVVRKTKEYCDRAKLIICKEVVELGILKESTFCWKHISLDLSLPIEIVDLIMDILEDAVSLALKLPCSMEDDNLVQYLTKILHKTTNLQILDLDAGILNKVLHDVFSDVGVQTLLGKLSCLDIHGCTFKSQSVYYLDTSEDDGDTPFQRNFLQLSMVPLNLKKFVFGKVIPISGSESDPVKFISNIIEASKETLEVLELHLSVWKFDAMKGIRCPKLRSLTLSAFGNENDTKIVQTFLKNQPPLEELAIEIKEEFPVRILETLQGMTAKMKKFHLKAKRFVGNSGPIDWSFLQTMNELKDFSIRKPSGWENNGLDIYGYGEDIVKRLPPSTQKIAVIGFQSFWKGDLGESDNNIGNLLERFENIKELNLLRSYASVTDDGLQSLITNCPNLLALTFSHCPEVGSLGICGTLETWEDHIDSGISLKDLKGLTRLKIRSCPEIGPEQLLSVVEFPYLRAFDYYRNTEVSLRFVAKKLLSKSFLLQIVKQNPCLEEVAVHIRTYDNDPDHISALRKEVKDINARVHRIEILEQSNWEDEDSDSDASSMHDHDGGSDFSGGNLYFDIYDEDYDYDYPSDYDVEDDDDDFDIYSG